MREFQQQPLQHLGVHVSLSTLHKYWVKQGYTWKKIWRLAKEADENEILTFWEILHTFLTDIDQLMFGDESHRNDKTVNRLY